MPYYRIVIWTKQRKQPFVGIRQYDNYEINNVYAMVRKKADDIYNGGLIDVEVQMLPKKCKAVQEYIIKEKK